MRVCFDTNVVIDIAGKTDWFLDSYASYDIALMRKFDTYITAASTTDIVYVLHRRGMSTKESNAQLPSLFFMFDVLDVTESDCRQAYENEMKDYENALVAECCARNNVDIIVTRNKKDFAHSPVPALTPREFIEAYKPENVSYDMVDFV